MSINRYLAVFLSVSVSLLSAIANAKGLTTYYHTDHLGSPAYTSNDFGEVKWQERYKPYGERIDKTPPAEENDIWYTGKPHDEDIGLTYMNARYYDPVVGRFMSIDPVGFVDNNLHSFNRYSYANNNPYKYVDPDGDYAELPIEGFSLALGVYSFNQNFQAGNYGAATIDALGIIADGILAAAPGAPGAVGIGIAAARGGGTAVKAAKGGSTTLYRAVGPDELADIHKTGKLINRGSAEGKYFTNSAEDASSYAKQAVKAFGDQPYTIIKTKVPTSSLPSPVSVDRGIPAYVLPNETLPGLKPEILNSMPIP